MMKKQGVLLALCVCCLGFLTACQEGTEEKTEVSEPADVQEGITYVTIQASYEDLVLERTINCSYKPVVQYDLSFGLSDHQIAELNVERGDIVEKGEVLARLEMAGVQEEITELEHTLSKDRLKLSQLLEQKEFELHAAYILYSYGKMEKADKEALKKEQEQIERQYLDRIEELEDTVTVNEAKLEAAKELLQKGVIVAPVTGEVTYLSGRLMIPGTSGITVVSQKDEKLISVGDVEECFFLSSDIEYMDYFEEGKEYSIQCLDSGEYAYYNVTPIEKDSWESNQSMKFALTDEDVMISTESMGIFHLNLGEKNNVLCVPKQVVHTSEDKYFVYVLKNGQREMQYVTVGITVGGKTEILSGLTEQDLIIADFAFSESGSEGGR